jgi:ankyrin repeat protein
MAEAASRNPAGGAKAVLKAAKAGDREAIRRLVEGDRALLEARDKDGSTPLHCAAWKGHAGAVAELIALGADVNARNANDHYGDTPLHAAAHGNHREVVELLIRHGADVHARNPAGRTPLGETAIHNAAAAARILKQHGAA